MDLFLSVPNRRAGFRIDIKNLPGMCSLSAPGERTAFRLTAIALNTHAAPDGRAGFEILLLTPLHPPSFFPTMGGRAGFRLTAIALNTHAAPGGRAGFKILY